MKELYFEANHDQSSELMALAYRIADNNYLLERYGRIEASHELKENRKTLELIFSILDRLEVPFWVQNTVIDIAENWRTYHDGTYIDRLKNKGVVMKRI